MFDSPDLIKHPKLRINVTDVVSVMTYGCESWFPIPKVMTKLNGVNSKMLEHHGDEHTAVRDESRSVTVHFDLVGT